MRISEVLRSKGSQVVTVAPGTTIRSLLDLLARDGIGAAVVSTDGTTVEGIVSERDIVRAMAVRGADVLVETVGDICTTTVTTVGPDDQLDDVMAAMTEGRFRHVPVVVSDRLAGIVSIGDVVKMRIRELESDREALAGYISSAG